MAHKRVKKLPAKHRLGPEVVTVLARRGGFHKQRARDVATRGRKPKHQKPANDEDTEEHLSVASSARLYHGTHPDHLARILSEGFRPRAETGVQRHKTKTAQAVFLTDSITGAMMYSAANDLAIPATVLEIDVEGLPLEPDYDDAAAIIGVDLGELTGRFRRDNVDLDEWEPRVGAVIPEDLVSVVEEAVQDAADSMYGERSEPFALSVDYEMRDGKQVAVLYAVPTVGLSIATSGYRHALIEAFDFAPDTIGYEEGEPKLMIQQYLCRCTIPVERIVRVWIEDTAFPSNVDHSQWGYPTKDIVDYDHLTWNEDEYMNVEDALREDPDSVDFHKRRLIGMPLADAVRLLGA